MEKLTHYGYPYALLVNDLDEALRLHDTRYQIVLAESDRPETYRLVRAERAALVAATGNDLANTNVAFTVREMSESVPIVTTASSEDSLDILRLAGSSYVIQLGEMMGQALARRIIGSMRELMSSESSASCWLRKRQRREPRLWEGRLPKATFASTPD
jgi:Trk K+ transport system NAD-binding subunit